MSFKLKLTRSISSNNSLLCLGLDPVPGKLPSVTRDHDDPVLSFNKAIIESTCDLVCAYKPNFAFFGALGEKGWTTLKQTLAQIPESIPVIIDAKVGDIRNTSEMYARMFLDQLGADGLTVNPYMGKDALTPFLERPGKCAFLLCLTSNEGARDFEQQQLTDGPLYELVATKAAQWSNDESCGLVVGATQPESLGRIREIAPDLPILIPGVGAQGGDLESAVTLGQRSSGDGILVNASRSVLYAGQGTDYAQAARAAAEELREQINQFRTVVSES